jgi:hypothetical protein
MVAEGRETSKVDTTVLAFLQNAHCKMQLERGNQQKTENMKNLLKNKELIKIKYLKLKKLCWIGLTFRLVIS